MSDEERIVESIAMYAKPEIERWIEGTTEYADRDRAGLYALMKKEWAS